jgi:hypothetical protein
MLTPHIHALSDVCLCYQLALDPRDCPEHGHPLSPRCWICGQLMEEGSMEPEE